MGRVPSSWSRATGCIEVGDSEIIEKFKENALMAKKEGTVSFMTLPGWAERSSGESQLDQT
jgi:hypothetical protein